MRSGFQLGSVAGIAVHVDWSLLIVFFVIASSLAGGLFPAAHPDWTPGHTWATAVAAALLFFASILAHELSHAIVGRARGIPVLGITLFVFGGVAQIAREPGDWRAELVMAIAGPITSLVLGFAFLLLADLTGGSARIDRDDIVGTLAQLGTLPTLLVWLGQVNIVLALFNLVPGFPLDGGRVLRAMIWGATGDVDRATRWASGAGQAFAWLLIGIGISMLLGAHVPVFGSGPIGGIWLALIGWFLNKAALVSSQRAL